MCLLGHNVLICGSVAFANTILHSSSLQFHQTFLKSCQNLLTWHTWTNFAAEVLSSRKSSSNFFPFDPCWPSINLNISVPPSADDFSVDVQQLRLSYLKNHRSQNALSLDICEIWYVCTLSIASGEKQLQVLYIPREVSDWWQLLALTITVCHLGWDNSP